MRSEGPAPEDKIADEEVTDQQVEATVEAAEAEGHATMTAEGVLDAPDEAQEEPEGEPVAAGVEAAAEGVPPADEAEGDTETETEPEPEPVDPRSPASEDELRLGLLETFKEHLGDGVVAAHIVDGHHLWIRVATDSWRAAAEVLRDRVGCTSFTFLNAIDWLPSPYGRSETSPFDPPAERDSTLEAGYAGGETRFQVLLHASNPERGFDITIKADVPDPEVGVETIIPVYRGADWHERETWEMYGITFRGHPHLVHLYLPTGFEGNPLRKDFPLLAREVKPWPGIVDVEPMPDDGDDAEADATEEVSA